MASEGWRFPPTAGRTWRPRPTASPQLALLHDWHRVGGDPLKSLNYLRLVHSYQQANTHNCARMPAAGTPPGGEKATQYLSLQNIPARVGGAVPQRPQILKSFSPIFWNKNSPL